MLPLRRRAWRAFSSSSPARVSSGPAEPLLDLLGLLGDFEFDPAEVVGGGPGAAVGTRDPFLHFPDDFLEGLLRIGRLRQHAAEIAGHDIGQATEMRHGGHQLFENHWPAAIDRLSGPHDEVEAVGTNGRNTVSDFTIRSFPTAGISGGGVPQEGLASGTSAESSLSGVIPANRSFSLVSPWQGAGELLLVGRGTSMISETSGRERSENGAG